VLRRRAFADGRETGRDRAGDGRAFNNEYLRRLTEELEKQKTKFRSVPVPKNIKSDGRQALETQVGPNPPPHPTRARCPIAACRAPRWSRSTVLPAAGAGHDMCTW